MLVICSLYLTCDEADTLQGKCGVLFLLNTFTALAGMFPLVASTHFSD